MHLMGMSYKDFFWENNPTSLTVSDARTVKETLLPFAGSRTGDLGPQKRRVTGEGYFTGETCWEQWTALQQVYAKGGPGALRLPGMKPFLALMDSLKLIGAAGENTVKYSFSFTEYRSGEPFGNGVWIAAEGEDLWELARRFDRTVEELTAANPHIRDVAWLREGEEVRIP